MKTAKILFPLLVLFWASALAEDYSTRNMVIRFNGLHDYQTHDFISEEINKYYLAERDNMRNQIRDDIDSKSRVSNVSVTMPNSISAIYFSSDASGNGKVEIRLNNISVNFDYIGCTYRTKFDIKITGNIARALNTTKLKFSITNLVAKDENFKVNDAEPSSGWFFWLDPLCNAGAIGVYIVHDYIFANDFKRRIQDKEFTIDFIGRLPETMLTSTQIQEAINSFPISCGFSGGANQDLVINVNFLQGTRANPTAFVGITPAAVTDPTFEHLGFNLSRGSLYDAFSTYEPANRPFTSTGETGNLAQRNFIIQSMKNYLGRTVSFYFHWGDIAIDQNGTSLLVNGNFDPATLTGSTLETKIAELYAQGTWQKSTDILASLHENEFDVVATVGTGGYMRNASGGADEMAPDRTRTDRQLVDPVKKQMGSICEQKYLFVLPENICSCCCAQV